QSDEVFVTRSTYDDSKPTTPSPFLTRLKAYLESQDYNFSLNSDYKDILEFLTSTNKLKKQYDRPIPTPPQEARVAKLSATGIEKIVKNPYWYYAKEILNLKKLDNLEEPTERRDYGQFVHNALEEFSNFHQLNQDKITVNELNRILAKHY